MRKQFEEKRGALLPLWTQDVGEDARKRMVLEARTMSMEDFGRLQQARRDDAERQDARRIYHTEVCRVQQGR